MSPGAATIIQCPACGAACPGAPLQLFTADLAAQHFVLREEFPAQHEQLVAHIRASWGQRDAELHACPACGLQFAWPFVAGDGTFYNLAYPYSEYPAERWEFDQTVAELRRSMPPQGMLLEIGSGFGYFLRKVSPSLLPAQRVLAIEYNDTARAQLTQLGFHALAVDVRSDTFAAWRGQVSVLFMSQVLEHLDGLDALTARLNELLAPGAQIFMAVPNTARTTFDEANGGLLDMPPNHISRWTESAFRALAARVGWEMLDYRVQPFTWRDFIKRDLLYSHMRRAQVHGSLANRVRARPRSPGRMVLEGLLAVAAVPARVPVWLKALRSGLPLGDSVWVHFRAGSGVAR